MIVGLISLSSCVIIMSSFSLNTRGLLLLSATELYRPHSEGTFPELTSIVPVQGALPGRVVGSISPCCWMVCWLVVTAESI